MTVKELIIKLLDCDMDKEIYIADDVEFEDENGKCNGSVYGIESIEEKHNVYLNFDNRNHRSKSASSTGEGGEQDAVSV